MRYFLPVCSYVGTSSNFLGSIATVITDFSLDSATYPIFSHWLLIGFSPLY